MPGKVIGKSLNYGYPGQIARTGDEVSRTFPVKSGPINFGQAVQLNADGLAIPFAGEFAGVAMRRVKSALSYMGQNLGQYIEGDACDVLERGSITVKVVAGTAKPGGKVHVYKTAAAGKAVGDFAAVADTTLTTELTDVKFVTPADANGVAEIVILNRKGLQEVKV